MNFNTRCRIEYKAVTQDSNGNDVTAWTLLGVRWCDTQDALPSRSEAVKNGLVVSMNQTRFRLRYCTDVDTTMRVTIMRESAVIYNLISGPAVSKDKTYIEFMLERVSVDNG